MSVKTRGSDVSRGMPVPLHCHLPCSWGRSERGGQPAVAKAALCKKTPHKKASHSCQGGGSQRQTTKSSLFSPSLQEDCMANAQPMWGECLLHSLHSASVQNAINRQMQVCPQTAQWIRNAPHVALTWSHLTHTPKQQRGENAVKHFFLC